MPNRYNCEIDEELLLMWADQYIQVVIEIAQWRKWPMEEIYLSRKAMAGGLLDASKDCDMTQLRRPGEPITRAQMAGILTFRLTRYAPIAVGKKLNEDLNALNINVYAAIAFSCKVILGIDASQLPPSASRDLVHFLTRRHINQETLGLVFEMISHYSE
ncbi:MAG: hypothetical protein HQL70_08275 [Magnetococcales bacterium]|nr:hypothetical protein [Magnetococcales bacterium]